MASYAPLAGDWRRLRLYTFTLLLISLVCSHKITACDHDHETSNDELLCRQCGHAVTTADSLVTVPSHLAASQRNATILGITHVLIQRFRNPDGNFFEVITAQKSNVLKYGETFAEYSWFPGYAWTICICPKCGFHLGWAFDQARPSQVNTDPGSDSGTDSRTDSRTDSVSGTTPSSFIGLILDNLLHKDFADSLLITPKFHSS